MKNLQKLEIVKMKIEQLTGLMERTKFRHGKLSATIHHPPVMASEARPSILEARGDGLPRCARTDGSIFSPRRSSRQQPLRSIQQLGPRLKGRPLTMTALHKAPCIARSHTKVQALE
jgi:hypothetical protein